MRARLPFPSVVEKASRVLARATSRQWLTLRGEQPVVSITFDDVIATACTAGAEILQAHGARGTYYVAGGLTGQTEDGRAAHTVEQLRSLHAAGHELGCHGWSHRRYTEFTQAQLRGDLDRNAAFVHSITGVAPENFAYPFGAYDYLTKRICAPRFQSCRVLGGGIYRDRVDLGNMGCWRLYGETRKPERWREALDGIASGGWAILNTHAVDADCGPYGCTPEDLDEVLRHATSMGALILPVSVAISHWRRRA